MLLIYCNIIPLFVGKVNLNYQKGGDFRVIGGAFGPNCEKITKRAGIFLHLAYLKNIDRHLIKEIKNYIIYISVFLQVKKYNDKISKEQKNKWEKFFLKT